MKIFKYPIVLPRTELFLPKDAKIISFQNQNDSLVIWALVNFDNDIVLRKLVIYGTGHEITEPTYKLIFIGTAQLHGFVWHLFEYIE